MVDIQKFVELANKYAPELGARYFDDKWVGLDVSEYMQGADTYSNARFTLTLLEYLKGQMESIKPIRLMMQTYTRSENVLMAWMDKRWLDLAPEAVIQACIDYWEAME